MAAALEVLSKARIERVQIGDEVSFHDDDAMLAHLSVATRNFVLRDMADMKDMIFPQTTEIFETFRHWNNPNGLSPLPFLGMDAG